MSGDKALPQVLVSVKDPDTVIHGAHEFKRVENARRVRHAVGEWDDPGWQVRSEWWTCGECGQWLVDSWHYCPECGRRLQNPEGGDRA